MLFRVYDNDGTKPNVEDHLLMIAPLKTIEQVFRLHKEASKRIECEAPCVLHLHNSFLGAFTVATVPNTEEWQP